MKIFLITILLAALSLYVTGCSRSEAGVQAQSAHAIAPAAQYKASHGITLSQEAKAFIGLTTSEVVSRDIGTVTGINAVPVSALLRTVRGDFVFVANGEWYLRTPVTIGTSDEHWYEIRDGLYEGDTVVTNGTHALWLTEIQAVNGGVGCADGH